MTATKQSGSCQSEHPAPVTHDSPKPFGGASAARPARHTRTDVHGALANDNTRPPCNDNSRQQSVREDMEARLGRFIPRSALDWFTGKSILDGKSKPWSLDPMSYFALNVGIGFVAAATTAAVITYAPAFAPFVVPWTVLIQTGRMRRASNSSWARSQSRKLLPAGRSPAERQASGLSRDAPQ